jgi:hypothetical protein
MTEEPIRKAKFLNLLGPADRLSSQPVQHADPCLRNAAVKVRKKDLFTVLSITYRYSKKTLCRGASIWIVKCEVLSSLASLQGNIVIVSHTELV